LRAAGKRRFWSSAELVVPVFETERLLHNETQIRTARQFHSPAHDSGEGGTIGIRIHGCDDLTTDRHPGHSRPDEFRLLGVRFYKSRWQVELFFKWIKQHLRIKAFYGLSENAVKTQIWIAVSVYVLVAIVRKRLRLNASLYQILQILSLSLFEKMPILQALQPSDSQPEFPDPGKQLILFDL
jgi:hypothetical protein